MTTISFIAEPSKLICGPSHMHSSDGLWPIERHIGIMAKIDYLSGMFAPKFGILRSSHSIFVAANVQHSLVHATRLECSSNDDAVTNDGYGMYQALKCSSAVRQRFSMAHKGVSRQIAVYFFFHWQCLIALYIPMWTQGDFIIIHFKDLSNLDKVSIC